MRESHIPTFRRRYFSLVPAGVVLLIGAWLLYGYLGWGWWMFLLLPAVAVVFVTGAWRQSSVRCPHCHRLVYEQEECDVGRPIVFLCRQCDARLTTDIPRDAGG
jgi:hypothetical protein